MWTCSFSTAAMILLTPCKIHVLKFFQPSLDLTVDIVPRVSLSGPSQTTEYLLKNCQKCQSFCELFRRYKELAGYSCNINGWAHNRGKDLQRCQQLSCLLHNPAHTSKGQLDSSIIKPSPLPSASPSASFKRGNAQEGRGKTKKENEAPPLHLFPSL